MKTTKADPVVRLSPSEAQREVRRVLRELGWTHRRLADAVGVDVTQVSRWKHGRVGMSAMSLARWRAGIAAPARGASRK